ncbi:MAG: helix-turn-helix domain-containing protein [Candidatus Paceibacterota bacterium]
MFKRKFQIKNIAETFTAGDCLRRKREDRNLSLDEISRKLGIKYEYLESLEKSDYRSLPPQVYVRGFIKSYANFLDIDGGQLIKIYSREMSFFLKDEHSEGGEMTKSNKRRFSDYVTITPRILTFAASLFIIFVLGYYFVHQINSFNSKPYLFIEKPMSDSMVTKEKDLWLSGKTEDDAILEINGQIVTVGSDGGFMEKITLSEGRNSLIVEAKNRFNKSERREINIVYEKPDEKNVVVEEVDGEVETGKDVEIDMEEVKENNAITSASISDQNDTETITKNTTVPTDNKATFQENSKID